MRQRKNNQPKSAKKAPANGQIRIIAGTHRGRKLPVLDAQGLRPTTDRVKETVFNWLMPYIHNSQCLDCFAGAGSLGFEALSRGAAHVDMLELDKQAAKQLKSNKQLLSVNNCEITHTDSLQFLQQTATKQYDLVFIDPPFRQQLVQKSVDLLLNNWLSNEAFIYIEREVEDANFVPPQHWSLLKEKTAGQVIYQLYQNNLNSL